MIETTIPEINVLELMERVRAKADEIRRLEARPKLPPIAEVQSPPRAVLPAAVTPKTRQIAEALDDARRAVRVPRWIPKPLRVFFRRHEHYERDVLRSLESLAQTNTQLADRLRHLAACVEVQDHAIQHLTDVRRLDGDWMSRVAELVVTANERVAEARAALRAEVDAQLAQHREQHAAAMQHVAAFERQLAGYNDSLANARSEQAQLRSDLETIGAAASALRADFERAGEHLRHLDDEVVRLRALAGGTRSDVDRAGEHLRNLQHQADKIIADASPLGHRLDALQGEFRIVRDELNRTEEHVRNLQALFDQHASTRPLKSALSQLDERLTADTMFLKSELSQQRSVVAQLLNRTPASSARQKLRPPDKAGTAAGHALLDAFYTSFEDRFRGSRSDVARRQRVYLDTVRAAVSSGEGRPVLDLGCGRGEWLELLKAERIKSEGADLNATMVAQCAARGLPVSHSDAIAYLRRQQPDSASAITGFHLIEHLEFATLLALVAETYRVLAPGGVAIFESPSCKNLVVGACNFNSDPTHRNPVFPETAQFILSLTGFSNVELRFLHPVDAKLFEGSDRVSAVLNELLYGPQDFAVIGQKTPRR